MEPLIPKIGSVLNVPTQKPAQKAKEQPKEELAPKPDLKEINEQKDLQELKSVIYQLNDIPILNESLRFSFSNEANMLMVQIRDKKTDDVLRQYPSENFIRDIMYFRDNIGMLLDIKG